MKKFIALITVLILVIPSSVFADYYRDYERPDITFQEMAEYSPDIDEAIKEADIIIDMIMSQKSCDKILDKMDAVFEKGIISYATRLELDYILSALDNSDENNKRFTENYNKILMLDEKLSHISKILFESDKYRDEFIKWQELTEEETEEIIDGLPDSEEFAITAEINKILEEYYNNQFGTEKIEINGKLRTLNDILSSRRDDIYDLYVTYSKQSSKKLGEIFVRLTKLRNKLAKHCGYENYAEYAFSEVYPKDFPKEQRLEFYQGVKACIVPLYLDLYKACSYIAELHSDGAELSDEEILQKSRDYIEKINPELTEGFDYMLSHNLCDIKTSEKKKAGSFTAQLYQFSVPYMVVNEEQSQKFTTLIHEYGHFNAGFHDPYVLENKIITEPESMNLDIAEIHSQGLEVLFMDYFGEIYGDNGAFKRLSQLMSLCSSIVDGCLYSQWQEAVYAEENLTPKKASSLFLEACKEYGVSHLYPSDEEGCYEWIAVPHNFETPMYYISYALSATVCMELYQMEQNDREYAIDKYMKLTAMGQYRGLSETLTKAGFSDIFAKSTLENAVKSVYSGTALGFSDVTIDDWFFIDVIETAEFMDGISETQFAPHAQADRLTFVNAIGRMYDDCEEVIFPEKSPFTDTHSKYAAWAYENSITDGIGGGLLGADSPLTREMAVCFLYRMAGSPEITGKSEFKDSNKISDWAEKAIIWAEEAEIIAGYEDGTFRPQKNLTRAEAASLVTTAYFMIF